MADWEQEAYERRREDERREAERAEAEMYAEQQRQHDAEQALAYAIDVLGPHQVAHNAIDFLAGRWPASTPPAPEPF